MLNVLVLQDQLLLFSLLINVISFYLVHLSGGLICMSLFSIYVYLCLSFDESALEFGPWCCWKVLIVAMRLQV